MVVYSGRVIAELGLVSAVSNSGPREDTYCLCNGDMSGVDNCSEW